VHKGQRPSSEAIVVILYDEFLIYLWNEIEKIFSRGWLASHLTWTKLKGLLWILVSQT
jgi:hypothetical protein